MSIEERHRRTGDIFKELVGHNKRLDFVPRNICQNECAVKKKKKMHYSLGVLKLQ